jgi:hypothetical protein
LNSTNPVPPYTDWSIAATNIQAAVDAANTGDTVLVTNGVYATGGRKWFDSGTNRVTLTNAVTLQSVNGPAVTLIVGSQVVGTGMALTNAVRCVGIGNNAVLSGFTLTNGEAGTGNYPMGGGVAYIYGSGGGVVSNCLLIGNLATNSTGGGAYGVRLINCQITGNYAADGGGADNSTLYNCVLSGNSAQFGGGIYDGTANNCLIVSNVAINTGTGARGGGAYGAALSDCTVAANSSGQQGGGVDESHTVQNCLVYYNSASFGPNINGGGIFTNCCTTPLPTGGRSNFTNAPLFVNLAAGDFHLQSNSPCINSGNNAFITSATDLDGNPRIVGGTVDIGAYEYQTPVSQISYVWLDQYGLPIVAGIDTSDLDGSGMTVYQDWIAGLNPTNSLSVLAMLPPAPTNSPAGLIASWQSVSGIIYFLQSSTNLGAQPAFSSIQSNIVGQAGTTSYTDTNAVGTGPYFYRVGVQ